jgi:hypothetical protein
MKNILIDATQPQRFLDQVNFAKNIVNETDKFVISFFISDEVYSLYGDIVKSLEFKVINEPKKESKLSNSNNFKYIIKEKIKNKIRIDQRKKIRKFISIL